MNGVLPIIVGLLLAAGGTACGNGLVPGTRFDQPLLSFSGTISPTGGLTDAQHPIIGLLWTDPLQQKPDVPMPAQWLRSSVNAAGDSFTVDIFRAPPTQALVDLADSTGALSRLAVAEIVIVDDQDGDGTFGVQGRRATILSPDLYRAGSANVLTYVAIPYPSPSKNPPLTLPAQSGYALVNYICQGQLSAGTHMVSAAAVGMILQRSQDLPEGRTCRNSHGP